LGRGVWRELEVGREGGGREEAEPDAGGEGLQGVVEGGEEDAEEEGQDEDDAGIADAREEEAPQEHAQVEGGGAQGDCGEHFVAVSCGGDREPGDGKEREPEGAGPVGKEGECDRACERAESAEGAQVGALDGAV
jgi:hypothetical protein